MKEWTENILVAGGDDDVLYQDQLRWRGLGDGSSVFGSL